MQSITELESSMLRFCFTSLPISCSKQIMYYKYMEQKYVYRAPHFMGSMYQNYLQENGYYRNNHFDGAHLIKMEKVLCSLS